MVEMELNDETNFTKMNNFPDVEVDSWFLMDNLTPIVLIIAAYLAFVLKIGPQFMENRKPFILKEGLLLYNLAITLFNAYLFKTFMPAMSYPIQYLCIPHPNKRALALTKILYEGGWYYLISKIIELSDTVFFVLRKKQSQISTLHVFHHTNMVFNTWMYLKYLRSEQGILVGILNTFVHIIMYFYYFLAAFGPKVQKYLWWKKYLTVLQMIQFVIIFAYLTTLLVMNCEVHRGLSAYMATHTIVFLVMFSNFYNKAYLVEKSKLNVKNWCQKSKTK